MRKGEGLVGFECRVLLGWFFFFFCAFLNWGFSSEIQFFFSFSFPNFLGHQTIYFVLDLSCSPSV